MKKQSQSNSNGKMRAFRNFLKNNTKVALYTLMGFSTVEIKRYAKYFKNSQYVKKIIAGCTFPSQIVEMEKETTLFDSSTVSSSFKYYTHKLIFFFEEINDFLTLKHDFEKSTTCGWYQNAEDTLNQIERKFGLSFWLTEARLTLYQYLTPEKQQDLFLKIAHDENAPFLFRFLVYFTALKLREDISFNHYQAEVDRFLSYLKESKALQSYFLFQISLCNNPFEPSDYINMLFLQDQLPILDRYLFLVKISQYILSQNDQDYVDTIHKSLKALDLIHDPHKEKTLFMLSNFDTESNLSLDYLAALNLYVEEDDFNCFDYCLEKLKEYPLSFDFYELYSKVSAYLAKEVIQPKQEDCIQKHLLYYVYTIIVKSSYMQDSKQKLLKMALIPFNNSFKYEVLFFLQKESLLDGNKYFNQSMKSLNSNLIIPDNGELLSGNRQKSFYIQLKSKKNLTITNIYKNLYVNQDPSFFDLIISNNRVLRYKGTLLQSLALYKEASSIFQNIVESHELCYYYSLSDLIKCFLKQNETAQAIDIITYYYILNNNISPILSLSEVVKILEENYALSGNISSPIIWDIYVKTIDPEEETNKCSAYEEFLEYHNCSRPSQLKHIAHKFPLDKLIYYLKNICVQSVMDSSAEFLSSKDIEKERIQVCQQLIDLDKKNSNIYLEEIKEITQNLIVRERTLEVEQSKIYVNIEGIKKAVEQTLSKNYNSYTKTLKNKRRLFTFELHDGEAIIREIYRYDNLFTNLVLDLRDRFVSSDKHGLDGYLSVGIRHGTISGQLRHPLGSANLMTQKDNNGIYKENEYWVKKYSTMDENSLKIIIENLKMFSQQIDELIGELKDNLIQIHTEKKKSDGFFDFTISNSELFNLSQKVTHTTSYEDFLAIVFQYLWEKTDQNLKIIRQFVSDDLKEQFYNVFENLITSLNTLRENKDIHLLITSINNAKTSIQNELDRVANWFQISKLDKIQDFQLNLAIKIGIEIIKNIYPNVKKPAVDVKKNEVFLKGASLKSFVDIIFILLDNIKKHSDSAKLPDIKIMSSYKQDQLFFRVENNCIDNKNIDPRRLSIIKSNLENQQMLNEVSKEGGTGFYKIKKIIQFDLNSNYKINFDYDDNNSSFFVDLNIDIRGLIIENTNS